MPFLAPCPSVAWPPHRVNNSGRSTRVETLLPVPQDSAYKFKLSLEPAVASPVEGSNRQELQEIQPAFFGNPVEGSDANNNKSAKFDPSLADIQVAVESSVDSLNTIDSSQDDTSVLKGRVLFVGGSNNINTSTESQTPASNKITPGSMQPLSIQRLPDYWPLLLYCKIDKEGVYQMDGRQLLHAEVAYSENSDMPPCLMLVFPCCIFRIFPMHCPSATTKPAPDSDTPKKEWKIEALEALQCLEKKILQLSSNASSPSPLSPCESSFPSSTGEAGQKDGGYGGQSHSHSTLTSSSNSSSRPQAKKLKTANTSNEEEEDDSADLILQENHCIIKKAKRRRDALTRSRVGVQSVETVLAMPVSVVKPGRLLPKVHLETQATPLTDSASAPKTQGYLGRGHPKSSRSPEMSMGPLLSGIAEDLSASYGTNAERKEVLQLYSREIEERRHHRMDQLLDSFFPSMPQRPSSRGRKARRGKDGSMSVASGEKSTTGETKSAEEVILSVRSLMNKQRELVNERSTFLQLPTRGS